MSATGLEYSIPKSVITCPACNARSAEEMPENACLHFFECPSCKTLLCPLTGDCCVFCSFGDQPCPPRANERRGRG